jgi:hypothetical protein
MENLSFGWRIRDKALPYVEPFVSSETAWLRVREDLNAKSTASRFMRDRRTGAVDYYHDIIANVKPEVPSCMQILQLRFGQSSCLLPT